MTSKMASSQSSRGTAHVSARYIPLSYNHADSQASALRLVLALRPEWEHAEGKIEFVRFTDGITNTLLKIIRRAPGLTDEEIDNESVLMRAYGNHTEVLIDREKEVRSHSLLSSQGLAPPLLARFKNGLLYRFIRGQPASPHDLTQPHIWRGVARRLAQWHAVLPIRDTSPNTTIPGAPHLPGAYSEAVTGNTKRTAPVDDAITPIRVEEPGAPTVWTVLQKWIIALPTSTEKQRERRKLLQKEFEKIVMELDDGSGLGENGLVFAHCDLLCANVIRHPRATTPNSDDAVETVSFIDYEYATPSPAAFDIANHFAEWGGYDCDYNMMPTRSTRRGFLTEYVRSYSKYADLGQSQEAAVEQLFRDVDRFRGIPGFYWGVWALIQATISQIDFDYANYAEERLGEYWAWRREVDGSRSKAGDKMPLRESRWAQEA